MLTEATRQISRQLERTQRASHRNIRRHLAQNHAQRVVTSRRIARIKRSADAVKHRVQSRLIVAMRVHQPALQVVARRDSWRMLNHPIAGQLPQPVHAESISIAENQVDTSEQILRNGNHLRERQRLQMMSHTLGIQLLLLLVQRHHMYLVVAQALSVVNEVTSLHTRVAVPQVAGAIHRFEEVTTVLHNCFILRVDHIIRRKEGQLLVESGELVADRVGYLIALAIENRLENVVLLLEQLRVRELLQVALHLFGSVARAHHAAGRLVADSFDLLGNILVHLVAFNGKVRERLGAKSLRHLRGKLAPRRFWKFTGTRRPEGHARRSFYRLNCLKITIVQHRVQSMSEQIVARIFQTHCVDNLKSFVTL